jgi:hypothetical protein
MRRTPRKERGPSMSHLAQIIEELQAEAALMCTQCLIDYVHEESDALTGKLSDLAVASAERGSRRDGEARYAKAFTEVMNTVLMVTVFTAELSNHRAVDWKDTDLPSTVIISLN